MPGRLACAAASCTAVFAWFTVFPPFEYLRNRRLETAMELLTQGLMNVTLAAYAVGYSSPSDFTKAFKKYFGHLPSENA